MQNYQELDQRMSSLRALIRISEHTIRICKRSGHDGTVHEATQLRYESLQELRRLVGISSQLPVTELDAEVNLQE